MGSPSTQRAGGGTLMLDWSSATSSALGAGLPSKGFRLDGEFSPKADSGLAGIECEFWSQKHLVQTHTLLIADEQVRPRASVA